MSHLLKHYIRSKTYNFITSTANTLIVYTSNPPGNNAVLIVIGFFFWCVFCFYILNADKTTFFVYVLFAALIVINQN